MAQLWLNIPRRLSIVWLGVLLLLLATSSSAASADVYDRSFGAGVAAGADWSTQDLLRLRDLGGFEVSPDGRTIAFSVRQANLKSDTYVVRWFVVDAAGRRPPRPLSLPAGEPITFYAGGLSYGYIPPDPPRWSPDGRFVAIRRKSRDRVGLWILAPGRGRPRPAADGSAQVAAFAWSGDRLIFKTGLNASAFAAQVDKEALHGWRLDDRMTLWAARTPSPEPPDCVRRVVSEICDVRAWSVTPDATRRPASSSELKALEGAPEPGAPLGFVPAATVDPSRPYRVWTEPVDPRRRAALRPYRRLVTDDPRANGPCLARACSGQAILQVGLSPEGSTAWFTKRFSQHGDDVQGPLDRIGVFTWDLPSGEVRSIWAADGALEDCQARAMTLFCRQSSSLQPDRIVALDLAGGEMRPIVDPNPASRTKPNPRVESILLQDPAGNRGFGHLVYPSGPKPATGWPMVIVQYRSRGFLRGGTGEEYPILPLAAAGYLVLSVDLPVDLRTQATEGADQTMRAERRDRVAIANAVESISRAVDLLTANRTADPRRIAITGLSYGAEVVHHALRRDGRFAAAVASQGGADVSYLAQFGDRAQRARWMSAMGQNTLLPKAGDGLLARSWSQHPERLATPLLLNLGQDEAYFGFEGFAALQLAERPLEVRIFPREGHIKFRPRSFKGVYENNLLWLDFWLKGLAHPDPELDPVYARWSAMRARLKSERPTDLDRGGIDDVPQLLTPSPAALPSER